MNKHDNYDDGSKKLAAEIRRPQDNCSPGIGGWKVRVKVELLSSWLAVGITMAGPSSRV